MRYVFIAAIVILAAFMNHAVLTGISFMHASPDLLIFIVVFYAMYNGSQKGLAAGLAIGFFEDMLTGAYLGMNSLAKGTAGLIVGRAQAGFYEDNIMYGLVNIAIGSLVNALVILAVNIISSRLIFDTGLLISLGIQAAENIALAVPLYMAFAAIRQTKAMKRLWEES